MEVKHCHKCDTLKPTSAFYRNRAARDGLQTYCKPCHTTADKASKAKWSQHGS